MTGDREFRAVAVIGDKRLDNHGIRDAELDRARHALAYLKGKLGNDAMRRLLDDDLQAMAAQVALLHGPVQWRPGLERRRTVILP